MIVVEALLRIGRRAIKTPVQLVLAVARVRGIFFFELPFPLIVAAAGAIGLFRHAEKPTAASGRKNRAAWRRR